MRVLLTLKENGVSKQGGRIIAKKAIFFFLLFGISWTLILIIEPQTGLLFLLIWAVLGFSIAGLGMNVMHDANHDSFSQNRKLNRVLGIMMNLIGINPYIWKFQHNNMHHNYPNMQGYDEDLNMPPLIRMSPYMTCYWFHRYQQYYIWILYVMGTFVKAIFRDFVVIKHVNKIGAFSNHSQYKKHYAAMLAWKVTYFGYLVGIPLLIHPESPLMVLSGFMIMHAIIGCSLVIINFLAHFCPECEFRKPVVDGKLDDYWSAYQLKTTTNFATNSKFLNWFSGGLNHQVEHHLFPDISHVHYKLISSVVRQTAIEFDLPYHNTATLGEAVVAHYRLLKKMGTEQVCNHEQWSAI